MATKKKVVTKEQEPAQELSLKEQKALVKQAIDNGTWQKQFTK